MFESDPRTRALFGEGKGMLQTHLVWASCTVGSEVASWVSALITVAEVLPVAITLADMNLAGAPLVYVNGTFTKTTGYERAEVYGRNCRFLQGPGTQMGAIKKLSARLRMGVATTVELINYHKSGAPFRNLICLRPIHDSNGVYRFCIGIQLAIDDYIYMEESLRLVERLLLVLPDALEVGEAPPCGPRHTRERGAEGARSLSLRELLRNIQSSGDEKSKSKVSCTAAVGRAQSMKVLTKLQVPHPWPILHSDTEREVEACW